MNKGYQLGQLQTMLDNLLLSSGLYLIDTDLTDDDIEWHIKRDGRFFIIEVSCRRPMVVALLKHLLSI